MNNKQKNRKNKTSQVYSLLPEYQYVTGMAQLNMGGEAYDYDNYMTNQLFKAVDGTENSCPPGQTWNEEIGACVAIEIEVDGNQDPDTTNDDDTDATNDNATTSNQQLPPWMQNTYQIGPNPNGEYNYGDPYQTEHTEAVNSIMNNSLLGAAFMTANSLKGAGKRIKKAFANINPKTGLPYSHTDFGVSTLTNTTDENVLLNKEGLDNLYDNKGRIIDENNTADKLFINQDEAKAGYFNQIADYHSSTYVDDNEFLEDGVTSNPNYGKSLMSKQHMDKDGNITYADIEYDEEVQVDNPNYNPDLPIGDDNQPFITETVTKTRSHTDDDLTVGDNVQTHIKDLNASRVFFNSDYSGVDKFTRNNITNDGDDGQKTIEETIAYDPDADYTEGTNLEVINKQDVLNQQRYGNELLRAQDGLTDLRKFIYAQEGVETDAMTEMQNEYNKRNVGHFVEPSTYVDPTTLNQGVTSVNTNVINRSNSTTTTSTDGDTNYDYTGSFIENARNSNAEGTDNVRVDRNWLGKLFNRIDLRDGDITNQRDIRKIEEEYGMSIEELINSGRFKVADDGTTLTNTPYVTSSHSSSITNNDDETYNDAFGVYTLPNEKNQFQGGFGTSLTTGNNMSYDQDPETYWKNIGQYSTGEDNIYSNPEYRGSFLPEVKVTGKYGGQLAYFQNGGGTPQPSGRTYMIDGRVVTKEEYDNYVANGGQNATTDDDNIVAPDNTPLVPPVVPQYGPQNAPVMIDEDADNIPDTIDVDAGGGTNEPVEGVDPYSPTPDAPVSFSYTDKPELTEEQMAMMTEDQIEQYNKMRGKEEWWNETQAKYNTSLLGKTEKAVTGVIEEGMKFVDFKEQMDKKAQLAVDEANAANANDEYSDFAFAVEASRSDKGDFDVNSGAYRVNTLGYGDGPRGQIAQMGTETGGRPAPNYAYLKEFLDTAIVGYDPSFLMAQARDGEEIEANMDLIKQLMAAGADFEII